MVVDLEDLIDGEMILPYENPYKNEDIHQYTKKYIESVCTKNISLGTRKKCFKNVLFDTPENNKKYELYNPKKKRIELLLEIKSTLELFYNDLTTVKLLDKIWNCCYLDLFIMRNKMEKKIFGYNLVSFEDLEDTFDNLWEVH
jgi:hypothetical protein